MADRVRPRVLPLVAALLGVAAIVLLALAVLDPPTARVYPNVVVGAGGLVEAHNSPAVRRSPRDPDHLAIVDRQDRPGFSAALHVSRDRGRTWATTALPLRRGLDRPYAPDAAFAPDGTLYVTYVNLTGRGNVPQNLWVARSRDGGRRLEAPTRVAGPLTFQPRIVVGKEGTVHLTWMQATDVGLLKLVGPAPVVAARSTDGGRTFSAPVAVSDEDRPRVGAASPVIDPSTGNLFVLYQDFKRDVRDFGNLEGPPWPDPFGLVLSRSTDGGRTFSQGVEVESGVVATERFLVFTPEFPSLAAGPDGRLYLAWAGGRNGDGDAFVRSSADGGRTWTQATRVHDDPRGVQWLPQVAVAPDGRVDVAFLSRRGRRADAFLASSRDGGESFTERRLSTVSSDPSIAPRAAPRLEPDSGSRLGVASAESGAVVAWPDTRRGNPSTGRQDVFSARVDLPEAGTQRERLLLALVLLALGGAALVRWRTSSP